MEALDKRLKNLDNIDMLTNSIMNLQASIQNIYAVINKSIMKNNEQFMLCVVDVIKILIPSALRPTEAAIELINKRMQVHQIGNIEKNNCLNYTNKIWNSLDNNKQQQIDGSNTNHRKPRL